MRGAIASFSENRTISQVNNGSLPQLIQTINSQVDAATLQAAPYAKQFKGKTAEETARKIFDFLKTKVNYVADPPTRQDVKLPSRLVADNKGDCKSYSLFTMAILNNLGYTAGLRYAGYSLANKPTHVYSFILLPNGQKIIIDAVWGHFNSEKPFTYKKDYLMQINVLAGIGNSLTDQGQGGRGETRGSNQQAVKLPKNIAKVKRVKNLSGNLQELILTDPTINTGFIFILTKTPAIFKVANFVNARKIQIGATQVIPKGAVVVPVGNILPRYMADNNFLGVKFSTFAAPSFTYKSVVIQILKEIKARGLDDLGDIKELEKESKQLGNFIIGGSTPFAPSGAAQVLGVNYSKLQSTIKSYATGIQNAYLNQLNKKAQQSGTASSLANLSASQFKADAINKNKTGKGQPFYEYLYAAYLQYTKGNITYYEMLYYFNNGLFSPGIIYTQAGYDLANSLNQLATLRQNVINLIKNPSAAVDSIEASAKNYYQFYQNAAALIQSTTIAATATQEKAAKEILTNVINDSSKNPVAILVELQKSFYTQKTSGFLKFFPLSVASRGAFLALMRVNVFGLGSLIYLPTLSMAGVKPSAFLPALNTAIKGAKIYATWANGGGNPSELQRIAKQASKLKPLTLPLGNLSGNVKAAIQQLENSLPTGVNGIGVAAETGLAATLATAAPFVAAIVPLIIAMIPEAEGNGLLQSLGTGTPAATCKPRVKNAEGKTVIELSNELACLNKITDLPTAMQAAKDYATLAADIATTKNKYAFEGGEPVVILATLAAKAAEIVTKLKNQNTGGGSGGDTSGGGSGSGGDTSGGGSGSGGGKDNDSPGGGGKPSILNISPKTGLLLAGGLGLLLISNKK